MRLRSSETGWRCLLISTLLYTSAWAKKDAPGVSYAKSEHFPHNLQYFDDSDVLLYEDRDDAIVYRSEDAGETWKKITAVPEGKMLEISMHPFDSKRAYIITSGKSHWATNDRGEHWEEFFTDNQASVFRPALSYHAKDPDRIIFNAMDCTGIFCEELSMYTTNGFDKTTKFLRSDTAGCRWAVSSPEFTTGQKDLDKDRILCVAKGRYSVWRSDYRLVVSDDFFISDGSDIQEFEPELEPGRTVKGILEIAPQKKFLITAAGAARTDEMALYVSDDAIKWHRAEFPHDHKLTQEAYTILEGTNYSIQIDVLNTRPLNAMGVMFTSNSNGTYFTRNIEHTNRDMGGLVDFEKMAGVQGIVMVNVVDNFEKVEESFMEVKKKKSKISFDDGRTWQPLKVKDKDLHLHSVTELDNSGRVFSSPAPGLVMGNGNTGDYLGEWDKSNLYVSDDAGVTWHHALDGPHKYEFGDQGSILVAVQDGHTKVVKYSLNHGKDWKELELKGKIRPLQLVTTSDSTSLKFLMIGEDESDKKRTFYMISLDFDEMHERQCKKDDDLEKWYARRDGDGNPACLMGHTQYYMRRKADADCFMKQEFKDPVVQTDDCPCTDADFECDYNFIRSDDLKECIQKGALVVPEGQCKAFGPDDTFKGSSGWRLIPGNTCKRDSGKQKDDLVEHKCSTSAAPPASGKGNSTEFTFKGQAFLDKQYLERTGVSTKVDETIVLQTDQETIWLTHDHGKKWKQILKDEKIVRIYANQYFNDVVFFLTKTETVFYSVDRGENIRRFKAPHPPSREALAMNFHPKNKDWFIWMGEKCDGPGNCHTVASLTQDRGDSSWKTLQRYVRKCEFIKEAAKQQRDDKLIYCEVKERENNEANNPYQLVSSADFFDKPATVHFTNVVDFATMSEFIVVATKDNEHQTLKVDASFDGVNFADAKFPHGFEIDHQVGYTVLDSSTHSVFLHVTTNNEKGKEFGTIIKSNSNGTSYVLSLNAVDRDSTGYVDFEKMFGLEGVAMVNVVANAESKNYKKENKKLKTMITHNDGAEWAGLKPPAQGPDGKKWGCSGPIEKCSLNIHGYTERSDKTHTFSSQSAIGLMMGVGNVGEFLTDYKDADTFMTTDGGINWKWVKKGAYMWEFGDQGSIIVIVKEHASVNEVHYSLNEGDTWIPYKFSDAEMKVEDLTTVPSDNARNFLLWGTVDGALTAVNLDFSGLRDKQCDLDENDVEGGDYYLWQPKHPMQDDDCLFGHVSQYHRKRIDAECYNGRLIPSLHNIARNCSCTRRDFECDLNYERQSDGSCALVKGYSPPDHSEICRIDKNAVEYFKPTGYRRLPLTTCQAGNQMDVSDEAHSCAGHEDEFNRKHAASGWAIFFAIIIPIGIAAAVGTWVWRNWTGKFGQIRLGEQASFNDEAPYIKYPVMAVAAAVAVAQAIPLLASSLWRSASGSLGRNVPNRRFTTRDSFARGRGDYAVVDEDEGELLGEDSDEEV
ncbi:putative vacuolar protein sorting targeting protein pep1 protein [Botrytis cinerea BcDW1]|uniref:Vacuolar protein sorting/targeting protein 10 n=1 Tax=Botryotinia fuckeliana (strain BcDW1) TaxID=1290391 RepID=M7U668_BOTF1|nr:putative vacuolar protein sorting targeting protein pep1 protein [Botrytis cinerea BcDW1]